MTRNELDELKRRHEEVIETRNNSLFLARNKVETIWHKFDHDMAELGARQCMHCNNWYEAQALGNHEWECSLNPARIRTRLLV